MKRLIFKKLKLINLESIKITTLVCGWDLIFMAFLEIQLKHNFGSSEEYIRLAIAFIIILIIFILMVD